MALVALAGNYIAIMEVTSFSKWEYKQMMDSNNLRNQQSTSKAPTPTWPHSEREKKREGAKMNDEIGFIPQICRIIVWLQRSTEKTKSKNEKKWDIQ